MWQKHILIKRLWLSRRTDHFILFLKMICKTQYSLSSLCYIDTLAGFQVKPHVKCFICALNRHLINKNTVGFYYILKSKWSYELCIASKGPTMCKSHAQANSLYIPWFTSSPGTFSLAERPVRCNPKHLILECKLENTHTLSAPESYNIAKGT